MIESQTNIDESLKSLVMLNSKGTAENMKEGMNHGVTSLSNNVVWGGKVESQVDETELL